MPDKRVFLIVDDDPDDCMFFCEAVHEIDPTADCIIAENGEIALSKLRNELKEMPDFIFMDLNMPRMDGKQCLSELKKDIALKNIPVIIFTTSSYKKDEDDTRRLGASYYISKPPDFKKLHSEIEYVIREFSSN